MAKGSTGRKKTAKAAEPVVVAPPVRKKRSWFFQPKGLMLAAAVGVGLLSLPVLVRRLPSLQERPEYLISTAQVTTSPPPQWIPSNLTEQVFQRAGLSDQESLHDSSLSERIAAAFHTHPWIERVVSVRKSYPARVHVEVVYREPVAMVRGIDGHYPVDRKGVLLPARDFSEEDVNRFPVIERVASLPMGKLGESWGDPAVSGAAELAAVLNEEREEGPSWWQELQLASILVPQRVALSDDADELQYELRTVGGSEILWGRGPSARHPGELSVAQKVERLDRFRHDYGGFDDDHGPYVIDIRPWQGIERGILARQPRENSVH